MSRRVTRGWLAAASLLAVVSWPATQASAHAFLLSTVPPAGYTSPTAPSEIVLDFDEPVSAGSRPITLLDATGRVQRLTALAPRDGGREIAARVGARLARGAYTVRWQVVSDDGDPISGSFGFGVGVPAATGVGGGQGKPGIGWAAAWRWVLFTGLAVGVGGVAAARLTRRRVMASPVQPVEVTPWLTAGAALSLLAALALAIHVVGNGHPLTGLRHLNPARLADSEPGRVALTEAGAALVALIGALLRRRAVGVLGLLVVVGAEGWRSHLHSRDGAAGAVLTAGHLLLAAVWAGALLHVLRVGVAGRDHPGWARRLTRAYARVALLGVLALVGSGVAEALLLVHPWRAWWTTGYGRTLLIKLGFVIAALTAATIGRRRLRARTVDGQPEPGPAARWEAGALVAVLATTGVLVSLPTPSPIDTALAAPPAPIGAIVQLGALTGQVSISLTASAGQVIVRLTTPGGDEPGDGEETVPASTYQLTGTVATSSPSIAAGVAWRGCGSGCFTGPIDWQPSRNELRLTVRAKGWRGGTTTFTVPWYPVDATALARLALARLRGPERFTMVETVTSDTTGPGARPQTLTLSGARLLGAWPYGGGTIPHPVVLDHIGDNTEIGFAYPANNLYFRWTLDPAGRLLSQTISAPAHLIRDQFRYPAGIGVRAPL